MGRIYSATFSAVAVTAVQDFFEINPASAKSVRILGLFISQYSDVGDAQDELLSWAVKRGATTSGSAGSTPTAVPINPGDTAFGGTVEANNTTRASAGTIVTLHADTFNVRAGLVWVPPPEMRWGVDGGSRLIIGLEVAPADSLTMNGTVYFEES